MTSPSRPPLRSLDLVFLDTETTGLDPGRHAVVEVAALRVDAETLAPTHFVFEARLRPHTGAEVDPEALAVNGFGVEIEGFPFPTEVLPSLAPMLEGAIPVGHNVGFDLAFLREAYRRAGLPCPRWHYHAIDTAVLAWPLVRGGALESLSLASVCSLLGIENEGAHRAKRDVLRTFEVYRRLMKGFLWTGVTIPAEASR